MLSLGTQLPRICTHYPNASLNLPLGVQLVGLETPTVPPILLPPELIVPTTICQYEKTLRVDQMRTSGVR